MFKDILTNNYLTRGFWGDEAWTAMISRLSVPEILQVTGQDFHPPLYYLLVHWFMQLFGETEWIRSLSVVFFLLTLIPVYFLVKKLINSTAAWVSTLLVAFSPILFIYAFEARSYALLTLMSVLTTLFFWQALSSTKKSKQASAKSKKSWFIYAILGGLGIYTHYYLWFILASHGIYWLLADRRQFKQVFLVYLFILLAQLPWLPTLFSQVQTVAGDYWIGAINERTHAEYFMRIAAGDISTPWQVNLAKVIFATLLLSLILVWWKSKRRFPPGYLFLWSWLLVPILLPTLISFVKPVFFYRYLVFTSVPILIIVVWGISLLKKELLYALATLLLLVYLKTDYLIFARYPRTMREELAAAFAASEPPSSEVPVFTYLPSFAEVYFYTGQRAPVKVVPLGLVQFSGKSLLDKYVAKGLVEIVEPDESQSYWEFDQGPTAQFHGN